MTLYYPSGLYGPICDVVSEPISEPILYEISRLEPNIDTRKPDTDKEKVNSLKNIKLCTTIKVGTLLRGNTSSGYGPVCDVSSSVAFGPDSEGSSAFDLCPDDTPSTSVPEYTYKPPTIPEFAIDLPGFKCSIGEIETQLSDGTIKLIKYFKDCVPVVGDFPGWDPTDLGITLPTGKRTYSYYNSLVCGATNYYSAAGIYTNTIPQGISYLNVIMFGAGGGGGGHDASYGPTGSGNNSGGTGSFASLGINLNPSTTNNVTIVVGGGGGAGKTWVNEPNMTPPGYNRGGYGGYPGPNGVSGAGGGGGGATDVYLNNRLVASIAGGGGGGGNGCNYFRATTGKPWGNWNNKAYNGNPSTSQAGLIRSRFSGLMQYPVFNPPIKHSLWGSWFNQYVVWFNDGQDNFNGAELENRVNLNFATSGTYTFEFMGDNKLSVYIASWTDPGDGSYVDDILHNGSFPMKLVDPIIQDTTSPSTIANNGYSSWSLVGSTVTFTGSTPTTVTRSITAGRYVLRFIIFNEDRSKDWLYNPAGFAVRIKNPDGSEMWTTRYGFGKDGDSMTASIASGDGGGAGAGGGNEGLAGLVAGNTGLTGGSCGDADSTGQGGSAGWSYIINHPAVNVNFFDQAPGGFHSGWNCPTEKDASIRKGGGGLGGGRPTYFQFKYNGTVYNLVSNAGSYQEVTIPGMGTGVWRDFMNGKSFDYHYFWGLSKDGAPQLVPAGIKDGTGGYLFFGSYQGQTNSVASQRSSLYAGRSLELSIMWTPIKTGASTWDTKIRLLGLPDWGLGTGFADGDELPGVMPPSRSQGTQPWWDILHGSSTSWHVLEFLNTDTNKVEPATTGQTFNFSVIVGQTNQLDKFKSQEGKSGFVRTQFLSVDTTITAEI